MSLSEIQQIIQERAIHTVEIGFADLPGVIRGKRIPAEHFLRTAESGFALCKAALGWSIQCEVIVSDEDGYPDLIARPLIHTFREIPWRPGSALVLCDVFDEHGAAIESAPRHVLKRVVDAATGLGYRPVVGSELEFYILNEERKPFYEGIQCYSLHKGSEIEFVLEEIRSAVQAFGIVVEASNPEYGPAQVEINLLYDDALAIADKTLIFKYAVKEIARKHGLLATFMPKPWTDESGNGFHVHQSLWDAERRTNLFDKDEGLAHRYLAGLLDSARELVAISSPSVNAYKRYQDESFAPTTVTWGSDNRTVAVRALLGQGAASRIEQRIGAADANPYLIIAANIAAGLHGIAAGLEPPAITTRNAYTSDSPRLPRTLRDSLALLKTSSVAAEAFSREFLDSYLAILEHEVTVYDSVVTDWEQTRYLEMA